jgi:uncharacterized zinc-type alcohol dehydrogenase-like protein
MEIQARAATERGADLEPWTYELDDVGAHDCVVEVRACGLCRSDVHVVDNDWGTSRYPMVPGHEIVGEVVETGDYAEGLEVGDRVGIGWQHSSCLQCDDCLEGNENLCDDAESLIEDHYGGFAERVCVDHRFCFQLPDDLETLQAGPLLCGGITVYNALRHAGMASAEHVGVIGIGGLGHLAVQFASRLGNRVTAFTSTEGKADFARDMGADEVVVSAGSAPGDAPSRDLDILLNTAPVSFDWPAYMELLGTDGVLSIVGAPEEPLDIPANALMFGRRRVMGSVIGGRAEIREMLRVAADYDVAPVTEVFPMSEVDTALDKLRARDVRYRAVLDASSGV